MSDTDWIRVAALELLEYFVNGGEEQTQSDIEEIIKRHASKAEHTGSVGISNGFVDLLLPPATKLATWLAPEQARFLATALIEKADLIAIDQRLTNQPKKKKHRSKRKFTLSQTCF